jgi:putative transposase/transposase-like zinc-binding protein
VSRPPFEVADIVRSLGASLRQGLSRDQHRVVSAIEACRTAVLGGHVSACEDCAHIDIAYNSCRNRHCPKCQAAAAYDWLEARKVDLLPVAYYHVVFTLPAPVADIAYANKAAVYDALFKATSEALLTIAGDPRHLGARLGATLVLHTWGSAMTHHPHIHGIVPGGGFSQDGSAWIDCRKRFFLPVRVLSRLFRRLMCERLEALHAEGALQFFGRNAGLADRAAFAALLDQQRRRDWVVYAKRPFAGPEQVLSYLARYTHRIAISNQRITAFDGQRVTFRVKDYRKAGQDRYGVMTLPAAEFMRRFLLHVLPDGFHRIRHVGFLANTQRAKSVARARELLADRLPAPPPEPESAEPLVDAAPQPKPCPCCGGRMVLAEIIERASYLRPRRRPAPAIGINSS